MFNYKELSEIKNSLNRPTDKEAWELYNQISSRVFNIELADKIIDYFDKVNDNYNKIKFLEILLKYYNNPEIYGLLAITYKKIKNIEKAIENYNKAIELDPSNFIYRYNKGIILYELENYEEALICFEESEQCNKNIDVIFYNKGNTFLRLNEIYNAIKSYKRALELNPNFAEAYFNLGIAYEKAKLPSEALKSYEKACSLDPKNPSFEWNKSLMLLYNKNFENGFLAYESRIRKPNYKYILPGSRYKGESLFGKTLLVYSEQGFGDAILFARLLPELRKTGCKIILFTHKKLINLFKNNNFADKYYDLENIFTEQVYYDYYVSLLSLPAVLKKSIFDKEFLKPYIFADSKKDFSDKFDKTTFKVGIVWKGNPEPKANRIRHTELNNFAKVSKINNVKLYSFQLNGFEDINKSDLNITDLSCFINDFNDTANLLKEVDLLVTIDTAILHLAGSMGINTIALLPNTLDWRWNDSDCKSSLYINTEYIKQEYTENWDTVFDNLVLKIEEKLLQKNTVYNLEHVVEETNDLELLAAKYFNDGNYEESVKMFTAFLQKYGDKKQAFSNRGLALQKAGKFDDAINDYKKAIEIDPDYILARINLVSILLELKDFSQCENELKILIQKAGFTKETLFLSALFYHKIGKYDEAEKIYLKLKEDFEDDLTISVNLGMLYNEIGHYVKAANIFIEEIQKYPNNPELYFHLGNLYINFNEYERAIDWFIKAINLNNKYLDAYLNLGLAYFNLRKFNEAIILYQKLISLGFVDYRIYQSMGIVYYELKDYYKSEECLIKALQMENKAADLYIAYSETLLMLGNYNLGWQYYRNRVFKDPQLYFYTNKIPQNLTSIKNKKIIVVGEQGIGDNIMFGRYLIPLSEIQNFTFLIRKDLFDFFCKSLENYSIKVVTTDNLINYDYIIPLLDLPYLFKTSLNNIPNVNYSEKFYEFLGEQDYYKNDILKIGICWKGKEEPYHNRKRHMNVKKILRLFNKINLNELKIIALQHELTDSEKEICENYGIETPIYNNNDILETFKVINKLDLIITVDTSIAHIAGIIGKQTYLMLCYSPDWRWGFEGDKTNWYSSLKIFRQKTLDSWENVINEINLKLQEITDKKGN